MAIRKIVNCLNCGQVTEQRSDFVFISSFCCSDCKKEYYSTRPIRRKFRKTVNVIVGVLLAAGLGSSVLREKSADVKSKNDNPPVLEEQKPKDSNRKTQAEESRKYPAKGAVKSSD